MMKFDDSKVRYRLRVRYDTNTYMTSAFTSAQMAAIKQRLDAGDSWAWCTVRVRVHYEGIDCITKSFTLRGCTYDDKRDFVENCKLYHRVKRRLRDELHDCLGSIYTVLSGGAG